MDMKFGQRSDYTFKYNKQLGRHGWLRLTPAYSVKLVKEIIDSVPKDSFILDPFSGTATSGLVAAEQGLRYIQKLTGRQKVLKSREKATCNPLSWVLQIVYSYSLI